MFCPKCKIDMKQYNKNGIIIDACSHCQGIWLDRGELEKILEQERFNSFGYNNTVEHHYKDHNYHNKHDKHHDYHHGNKHGYYNDHKHHKKKKGILGILEDIFD